MWIKMNVLSGEIVTGQTLHSQKEADAENRRLKLAQSQHRWVVSLREAGEFADEMKEGKKCTK